MAFDRIMRRYGMDPIARNGRALQSPYSSHELVAPIADKRQQHEEQIVKSR